MFFTKNKSLNFIPTTTTAKVCIQENSQNVKKNDYRLKNYDVYFISTIKYSVMEIQNFGCYFSNSLKLGLAPRDSYLLKIINTFIFKYFRHSSLSFYFEILFILRFKIRARCTKM